MTENKDDYELEFDAKLSEELEKYKKLKAKNDKFRMIYGWIESLIDIADQMKLRIEKLEREINEIKKEMTNAN